MRVKDLYEADFYAWTREQAKFLRATPIPDNRMDRECIAEEIEDFGTGCGSPARASANASFSISTDYPGFRLRLPPACPYSLDQIADD